MEWKKNNFKFICTLCGFIIEKKIESYLEDGKSYEFLNLCPNCIK